MILKQTTKPASEPVSLTDVEAQCRIGSLSDESLAVERFIVAVRQKAEAVTRRALITQTWELVLDAFPAGRGVIALPLPPLQSVVSIIYTDADGIEQTLDPLAYRAITDAEPAYIIPAYGLSWPSALNDVAVVRIRFTCGYGPISGIGEDTATNVPEAIQQWILLNVANLYENRETVIVGKNSLVEINTLADSLLDDFRVRGW